MNCIGGQAAIKVINDYYQGLTKLFKDLSILFPERIYLLRRTLLRFRLNEAASLVFGQRRLSPS